MFYKKTWLFWNFSGASKIFPLNTIETNTTVNCDQDFYDFYHSAKIAQLCVFAPYAAYVLFGLFCMINIHSKRKYNKVDWFCFDYYFTSIVFVLRSHYFEII